MNQKIYNYLKQINKKIKLSAIVFLIITTALILIYSTFAWFRSSVDVKINSFDIYAEKNSDMLFSLDGINWSDTISVSKEKVIDELKERYSLHTNQWSKDGLSAISSNGIPNSYTDKFLFYENVKSLIERRIIDNEATINARTIKEGESSINQDFISFDLFVKNSTPSPYGDQLFLSNDTRVLGPNENADDENIDGLRIGIAVTPSIPLESSVQTIQNLGCMVGCTQYIYEPNSNYHTDKRIKELKKHYIAIKKDEYYPTYSMIKEGNDISIWSGIVNSGKGLDFDHFALQNTVVDESQNITILRNGIIKMRLYIWLEAQDIDVIERKSDGTNANIKLVFEKEMII